jgi:signal peptidase I
MDLWGILFALFARTLVLQLFSMPSGSMIPTLEVGDTFVASKYAYGYSRFSLPPFLSEKLSFLPAGRIFSFAPKRGDVVIFKMPRDLQTDYVKRVIGLPGDRIQMIAGRLYINGAIVEREQVAPYEIVGQLGKPFAAAHYIETLPGGSRHEIIEIEGDKGFLANTPVFETPQGHYFVMGDNRDNSTDSRVPPEKGGVGFVPRDNLEARAERVLLPGVTGGPEREAPRLFMAIR